jgi:hypothetical protein
VNESADLLALRKRLVLARCGLCRLQVRTGASELRGQLRWGNAGLAALKALPTLGLGLALAALARLRPTPPPPQDAALLRFARLAGFLAPLMNLLLEAAWTKKPNR